MRKIFWAAEDHLGKELSFLFHRSRLLIDGEVSLALAKYTGNSSLSPVMMSGLFKTGIDFNESISTAEGCISLSFEGKITELL